MEPKFQQTFIPRKPVAGRPTFGQPVKKNISVNISRRVNVLSMLATLIFIIAILGVCGVFGYSLYLKHNIERLHGELEAEIADLKHDEIEKVSLLDLRLRSAKTVIGKHVMSTNLLDLLGALTLHSIRYSDLSYETVPGGAPKLSISGSTNDFESVALQSSVLKNNSSVTEVQFSELDVDEDGDVVFTIEASFKPDLIQFKPN